MSLCFENDGRQLVLRPCTRLPSLPNTPTTKVIVKNRYPHDPLAFTQGLVLAPDGKRYFESLGLYGRSELREVELVTGKVLRKYKLPANQFAEGLVVLPSDQLVQLTWREGIVHVYPSNFTNGPSSSFRWNREGWGLTYHKDSLILSDGSSTLYFLQAQVPWAVQRTLSVRSVINNRYQPVLHLNELEMVGDDLYANIWLERKIAVIDLATGLVKHWLDLSSLPAVMKGSDAVLNGIAYHSPTSRLFVTGKLWPYVYEIESTFR